jgi:hypothetical protein
MYGIHCANFGICVNISFRPALQYHMLVDQFVMAIVRRESKVDRSDRKQWDGMGRLGNTQ